MSNPKDYRPTLQAQEQHATELLLTPEPLFFVCDNQIFQRPVKVRNGGMRMGFSVCTVHDGVDPAELCAILNKSQSAEPWE